MIGVYRSLCFGTLVQRSVWRILQVADKVVFPHDLVLALHVVLQVNAQCHNRKSHLRGYKITSGSFGFWTSCGKRGGGWTLEIISLPFTPIACNWSLVKEDDLPPRPAIINIYFRHRKLIPPMLTNSAGQLICFVDVPPFVWISFPVPTFQDDF